MTVSLRVVRNFVFVNQIPHYSVNVLSPFDSNLLQKLEKIPMMSPQYKSYGAGTSGLSSNQSFNKNFMTKNEFGKCLGIKVR